MAQQMEFSGQSVLVTGGSAGVGLAVARLLAARGATVGITGRNEARGREALQSLKIIDSGARFYCCDSGDYEALAAVVQQARSDMGGRIDILVSAGAEGTVKPTPFVDMSPQQLRASFETRFYPRIYPVHVAAPILRDQGGGAVVMIGTDAARHVTSGESMIGAAGASVVLLTKALARELGRWQIRVNTVAMTITSDTPSWNRVFGAQSFENKLFSKALSRFPQGRAPTADEVAEAAAYLASRRSQQVSGQTLSVNGGLSFGGW